MPNTNNTDRHETKEDAKWENENMGGSKQNAGQICESIKAGPPPKMTNNEGSSPLLS